MAQAGGGHFYDIASAAAIRDHISSEVGETLEVVARDVTLEVTLPEGVRVESLGAFPARDAGGRTRSSSSATSSPGRRWRCRCGSRSRSGEIGEHAPAVISLVDRDDVLDGAAGRLAWEYADDPANDAQPRDARCRPGHRPGVRGAARQEAVRAQPRAATTRAPGRRSRRPRGASGLRGPDPELRVARRRPARGGRDVPARDARAQPQGGLRVERQPHALPRYPGPGTPRRLTVRPVLEATTSCVSGGPSASEGDPARSRPCKDRRPIAIRPPLRTSGDPRVVGRRPGLPLRR